MAHQVMDNFCKKMSKFFLLCFIVSGILHIFFIFFSLTLRWSDVAPFSPMVETSLFQTQDINANEKNSSLPRLKLIVAILSAPKRMDRRTALRLTWMNECGGKDVLCRFFTDQLTSMEPKIKAAVVQEGLKYGDIEFMPIPGGINFGLRMLWLLEWAVRNYEFDFILRMDDDYFLCLRKLLMEIPHRVHIPK